jgi:hypothetical protein
MDTSNPPHGGPRRYKLLTSNHRVIDVAVGDPVTALVHGEMLVKIETDGDEPVSAEEQAWIRSTLAPLMKPWGT